MTNLENIKKAISLTFHGAEVKDVKIDDEFGNVTANVNGEKFVNCGFVEDYEATSEKQLYLDA